MRLIPRPQLTVTRVKLVGGQDRLRDLILYVAKRCVSATRFGRVKLNKIIWKADFDSYAVRQVPITGGRYQRLALGPALKDMAPTLRRMRDGGLLREEETVFEDGSEKITEFRPVALAEPNLALFTTEDIAFVDAAIVYYWDMTGNETSDDSHGIAWKTRKNGDPMPYELAFLSDKKIGARQIGRFSKTARALGLKSK
jgi:hypothetical protein